MDALYTKYDCSGKCMHGTHSITTAVVGSLLVYTSGRVCHWETKTG